MSCKVCVKPTRRQYFGYINSLVTGHGRQLVVGMAARLATTLPRPPLPRPGRSSEPRALVIHVTIVQIGLTHARNTPGRMMNDIVLNHLEIIIMINGKYVCEWKTG